MKGIFWNCRGLRDFAKHTFLRDTLREHNLEFIALLETYRKKFSIECLDNFCAGSEFYWFWNPPRGMSGGILLGVNLLTYVVNRIEMGEFYIKFHLTTKADGFRWVLMTVYGAAQEERKDEFLAELVRACSSCERIPLMVR